MRYRRTLLNTVSVLFLAGCFLYTIINYGTLSEGEGWGVVAMFGLAGLGVLGLIADVILQQFICDRKILNIVGAILVLTGAGFILFYK
jgi:hypothetical protein